MREYESAASPAHAHLPRVERSWTIGTVLAAGASFLTIILVVIGGFWNYAGLSYMTSNVPALQRTQDTLKDRVTVLEVQQRNMAQLTSAQYAEILRQMSSMSDKVDKLSENKVDKNAQGWRR
jgi:hypothetical protein